ncbi:MAG TPA: hydrogenase expression/formation protein HypE [Polyangiaceae bacterium]|nr:hydrogenase expression/formation protein HypE [Polyangiaceae bacterium]
MSSCPIPSESEIVLLAHGGGGRLTRKLIQELFWQELGEPTDGRRHDGVVLESRPGRPVLTTDAFVVRPLFFPGGNIGELAVYGTVNDLAMCGARPTELTASFILEEGLPLAVLRDVVRSMKQAADRSGVKIVTGDTKVVERGHGDQLFICTTGLGWVEPNVRVGPEQIAVGDQIIVSGDLGRHGIAVMATREGLTLSGDIQSDCQELTSQVQALLGAGIELHCMRDLTRGGLGAALIEIAQDARLQLNIDSGSIPLSAAVLGAAELFGLDPLLLPCEGRFAAFVPQSQLETTLAVLPSPFKARIGEVVQIEAARGKVVLETELGTQRELELPLGEQLPRIC